MRRTCLVAALLLPASLLYAENAQTPCGASAQENEEGFVSLFDGKTLDGWQGSTDGYDARDGILSSKKESGGRLFTIKEYSDFVLRFEFNLEPGGNNGIAIRAPMDGRTSRTGMEIQVLDGRYPAVSLGKALDLYHGHTLSLHADWQPAESYSL